MAAQHSTFYASLVVYFDNVAHSTLKWLPTTHVYFEGILLKLIFRWPLTAYFKGVPYRTFWVCLLEHILRWRPTLYFERSSHGVFSCLLTLFLLTFCLIEKFTSWDPFGSPPPLSARRDFLKLRHWCYIVFHHLLGILVLSITLTRSVQTCLFFNISSTDKVNA